MIKIAYWKKRERDKRSLFWFKHSLHRHTLYRQDGILSNHDLLGDTQYRTVKGAFVNLQTFIKASHKINRNFINDFL
jgi:hypothetical protein